MNQQANAIDVTHIGHALGVKQAEGVKSVAALAEEQLLGGAETGLFANKLVVDQIGLMIRDYLKEAGCKPLRPASNKVPVSDVDALVQKNSPIPQDQDRDVEKLDDEKLQLVYEHLYLGLDPLREDGKYNTGDTLVSAMLKVTKENWPRGAESLMFWDPTLEAQPKRVWECAHCLQKGQFALGMRFRSKRSVAGHVRECRRWILQHPVPP